MHFRRVVVEQIGQALSIATGFLDRLVLTAVLLRTWGSHGFEAWSVCIAAAGLISLFDFGFSLYFNNRLMEETETGRRNAAAQTLRMANTTFCAASTLGFVSIVAIAVLSAGAYPKLPVAVLAGGSALRIAVSGPLSLYRANRHYARLTLIQACGEVIRIGAAIVTCMLGGGLLAVATVSTAAVIATQVIWPIADTTKRFGANVSFGLIPRSEIPKVFGTSFAFCALMVPTILLTALPVLYLRTMNVGAGVLAAFVLMRTLAGVPRTLLQQFGVVLGQECSRRVAVGDNAGALQIISEGARLFAVLSGIATGLLVGIGLEICRLWTGSDQFFRMNYILAAVSPMVLTAFAVLAHNILVTTNAPLFATMGRWLQFLITAASVALLPIEDGALSMLVALSLGEIAGFAPLAYYGVVKLVPSVRVWLFASDCALSAAVAVLAAAISVSALWLTGNGTMVQRVVAIVIAAAVNAMLLPWVGIRSRTRQIFLEHFVHPRFALTSSPRG